MLSSLREEVIKIDVAEYVSKCLTCHKWRLGNCYEWRSGKREHMTMDFVMRLSRTTSGNDAIVLVVDSEESTQQRPWGECT